MARKYEELANQVVRLVGGKENISKVTHCITRLRFQLKDESLLQKEELEKVEGVMIVLKSNGQIHVGIGTHVGKVYDEVLKVAQIREDGSLENGKVDETIQEEKKGLFSKMMNNVSACMFPMVPALIAGGMLKGIMGLLAYFGLPYESGIYIVCTSIGDAVLQFMPVFIAYGACKRFGLSTINGVAIACLLCFSGIQGDTINIGEPLGSILGMDYYNTILGIPWISINYTYTVIPIILICYFASIIEKKATKIIPEAWRYSLVPVITITTSVIVGLLVIGPVIQLGTNAFMSILFAVLDFSPTLFGLFKGFTGLPTTLLGLHSAIWPVELTYWMTYGFDPIWAVGDMGSLALVGAAVAIMVKTKNKTKKQTAAGALIPWITGGISEPLMYGIAVPNKKIFLSIMCAAGIGGAILLTFIPGLYILGAEGLLFSILNYINGSDISACFWYAGVGLLTFVISFVFAWFLYKDEDEKIK